MKASKIRLIQTLKADKHNTLIGLEHVIVAVHQNIVTLSQVNRFLFTKSSFLGSEWPEMDNQALLGLTDEALKYIMNNRSEWRRQNQKYVSNLMKYQQNSQKHLKSLNIDDHLPKIQILQKLVIHVQDLKSKFFQKAQEYQEIFAFHRLLQEIVAFQQQSAKFVKSNDNQMQKVINQVISQETLKQAEMEKKETCLKLEKLEKSTKIIMKRLENIFNFYCHEKNLAGLTFEQHTKVLQEMDIKLYLKYFKDFQYQQANKYRYNKLIFSQFFKTQAKNGKSLSFEQFWNIHKKLFQINELSTKNQIYESQTQNLFLLKRKYDEELMKVNELGEIISEGRTNDKIRLFNVKTEVSPEKLGKSVSTSKITKNSNYQKSAFSEKESTIFGIKKNFIRQVREEVMNEQDEYNKRGIYKSASLNTLGTERSKKLVAVHLPKILKLSAEEISSQGIYKSLKRFADYDMVAQQKKIKNIIGLSTGDDQEFIQAYFSKQTKVKEQIVRQKSIGKEQRRKKKLEKVTHDHCRKYKALQIQPYFRF